jgi:small-conductance mechanosensitive channel
MTAPRHKEGLKVARILLVLSSVSPLFILWAIRGTNLIQDKYFLSACALLVVFPNLFLWWRISTAKRLKEKRELVVGSADDHRDHLLVYLFAMLLLFYANTLATWHALAAAMVALSFIVFLFWHLNLHYMNIVFAIFGFRLFTLHPAADGNPLTGRLSYAFITRRVNLPPGERITAYRISDTVYFEVNK